MRPKTSQKVKNLGKFSNKQDFHTKMEDNFHENNCKMAKTQETQEILEKTQGTGGSSLAHPPKKCPKKKPVLPSFSAAICCNFQFVTNQFFRISTGTVRDIKKRVITSNSTYFSPKHIELLGS